MRAITIGWWLMPLACALLLTAPSAELPADPLGLRGFRTPPLGPGLRLGQTFTMTTDGLSAVELFPIEDAKASGHIRFELHEVPADARATAVLRARDVEARQVVRLPSYRFEFDPVDKSKDRTYRVDVLTTDGGGVAFWATKGARYSGGSMYANGRARWADLVFRTDAPNPPVLTRVTSLIATNPYRAYTAIGAAVVAWLLLRIVLRAINAPGDTQSSALGS